MNRTSNALKLDTDSIELDRTPPIQIVVRPRNLVALTDQSGLGAEKFRSLAVRMRNFQARQQIKRILVTSSIKGEGKSMISANLALTLAQRQRTLLMDCDLHQSGLREVLGTHGQTGLAEWWRHSDPITQFLRRMHGLALWHLSAGQVVEHPLEILQSERFSEMLNQISRWFDWVIIDSPPLVPVADAAVLAGQADGTLLIVRQAHTPKPLLKEALKTENLRLLGIVANEWQNSDHRYYTRYYSDYARQPKIAPAHDQRLLGSLADEL